MIKYKFTNQVVQQWEKQTLDAATPCNWYIDQNGTIGQVQEVRGENVFIYFESDEFGIDSDESLELTPATVESIEITIS